MRGRRAWGRIEPRALRAAAIYALLSFVWIFASDSVANAVIPSARLRQEVEVGKGLAFVALTALLVWWLVRRSVRAAEGAVVARQASERQFRELLDGIDLLAVIFDGDGRVTFCNRGLLAATGRREEEVIGRAFGSEFLPDPIARERWAELAAGASADRGTGHAEVEIVARNGERRTVRWTSTLLRGPAGVVAGHAAVGEDVTDRLRFESEMRQVQKMDALGRLAGSVAHDFNNLLTAISGYTDLVLDELPAGDRARDDVEEIRRAADRGSALTGQLLAFSRRKPVQAGAVDLATTVAGMEPMLRRLLGEQVELVVQTCPGAWVVADATQLEQAVLNLAVNARDAMPSGGLLRIAVEPAEPSLVRDREVLGARPGPHVLVTVADSGSGVEPEVLPHLFEPFYTTKPKGKGTGLGLATVYSAVTAAQGHVWSENAPGGGAVFRLLIPAGEPGVSDERPGERQAHGRGSERVLVAEDDPAVRALVRTVLERDGYTVREAGDGEEALALAAQGADDLLVTDLVMPGMGGRELVTRLRATRPELPVLFISGYDEDAALLSDGERSLGSPLLRKPFSASQLGERVRALLDAS